MKLALACIVCLPIVGQNVCRFAPALAPESTAQGRPEIHIAGCTARQEEQIRETLRIATAIKYNRPFRLPDTANGSKLTAKATAIRNDAHTFALTTVEITTDDLVITADEIIYDWDTRELTPKGNVRLKVITQ